MPATGRADPLDGDPYEISRGRSLGLPDFRCPADATYVRRHLPLIPEFNALETAAKQLAGYKSDADVDAYIRCWSGRSKLRALYATKYKRIVKIASEASGAPFSIIACLFFRESHYDKDVVSPVGAIGLAQMMPGTWKSMLTYLEGKPGVKNPYVADNLRKGVPRDGKPLDLLVRKVEAVYATSYRNGVLSDLEQLKRVKSTLLDYQKLRGSKDAGSAENSLDLIDNALQKAEIQRIYARYVTKLGHKPKAMKSNDPEAAAIVGAYYLKSLVFDQIFEKDHKYRYPSHDRWVMAAGAYNSGPGNSKCTEQMTLEQCISATKVLETKNHMIAIRNCSEQGSQEPMPGDVGPECYK